MQIKCYIILNKIKEYRNLGDIIENICLSDEMNYCAKKYDAF